MLFDAFWTILKRKRERMGRGVKARRKEGEEKEKETGWGFWLEGRVWRGNSGWELKKREERGG